jgi:hypothetical protein
MFLFRLEFNLNGNSLNIEKEKIKIVEKEGIEYILESHENELIKNSSKFILKGKGFVSKEKAYTHAKEKVINSLMWSGINNNNGIELEGDKSGGLTKVEKELLKKNTNLEEKIINKSKIIVYEESSKPLIISAQAKGKAIRNGESFIKHFTDGLNYKLSRKQKTILELVNLSFFEYSQSAQFLSLISAFELFIEKRINQEENIVNFVSDKLLNKPSKYQEKYNLTDKQVNNLQSRIGMLKKCSIKENGRKIIEACLGHEKKYNNQIALDFFEDCYDIRSIIVHSKDELDKLNNNIIRELRNLVKDILLYRVKSNS